MKKTLGFLTILALTTFFIPTNSFNQLLTKGQIGSGMSIATEELEQTISLNDEVRAYLETKKSPLAPHTDFLLTKKHWKILIAISAIESQYCIRQIGNNCWGIVGGDSYQQYNSLEEAITDADNLITRWQARGRWHTVEDFNCHYVVPCNPNWVSVVNQVLNKMDSYGSTRRFSQQE